MKGWIKMKKRLIKSEPVEERTALEPERKAQDRNPRRRNWAFLRLCPNTSPFLIYYWFPCQNIAGKIEGRVRGSGNSENGKNDEDRNNLFPKRK